jgi:putative DNA primase/helicase
MQDDSRRGSEARPDLVELPGVRLAVTVEPEGGARLSTNMIKELTERDVMRVRQLNQPFITFPPQHRLVMMCNEKPVVRGTDKGTWRRIKNLAFRRRFVKAEDLADNPGARLIDFDLGQRLKARPEVVLAWLVAGWLSYAARGLAEPDSVRLETEAYRVENDQVGQFIKAMVVPWPGGFVTGQDLYAAYKGWCERSGIEAWSGTNFGRVAGTKLKKRTSGVVQYVDVRLRVATDE